MVPVKLYIHEDIHVDYIRWLFSQSRSSRRKPESSEIIVTPKYSIGKTIISLVKISPKPKTSYGSNHITIRIPASHLKKDCKFLYFDEFSTQQINYAIDSQFDIDFRNFCVTGREKGVKTYMVVQAFMRMYNMRNSPDLFERLKKRDYRRRKILDDFLIQGIKELEPSSQSIENQ